MMLRVILFKIFQPDFRKMHRSLIDIQATKNIVEDKLDFEKQKDYLIKKFTEWKGDYYQIDDILVLGFEV